MAQNHWSASRGVCSEYRNQSEFKLQKVPLKKEERRKEKKT